MTCGIYKILNNKTNQCYIGLSIKIEDRWRYHKRSLIGNRHENQHLQNAWNKYGEDSFLFEILGEYSCDLLSKKEKVIKN